MAIPWRRLRERFRRSPPGGEVAGSRIGSMLAPYIGELPLHPTAEARYALDHDDQTQALQLYRSVLRDERCMAALDQRLNAAISKPWEVEPGGESDIDRQAAADLAEQLQALEFDRICRQLLHGVWFGWSVGEAMWGRDASRVVLDDIVIRSLDRFWWSTEGRLLLRTYTDPQGAPVPAGKFVVVTRPGEHDDLPYAPGLARWCYWPVWLKRNGLQFWAIALEKFGAPTAVGKYPKGAQPKEKDELLRVMQALATGSAVSIPEDQAIELLATGQRQGGSGATDFAAFVEYLDKGITNIILGQSSTTDQGQWRGTAEVQKDIRDETVAADVRLLDSALNSTVARWLTAWNFPAAATPKIRHDAEPPEDLNRRAERERLISVATRRRPTLEHIVDVYGGEWEDAPTPAPFGGPPDPGEDDDPDAAALAGAADPPPAPPAEARPAGGQEPRDELAGDDPEDTVDELSGQARDQVGPLIDRWTGPARDFISQADSLDAVRQWIDTEAADAIDVSDVADRLREALAAAELAGRYDIEETPVEPVSVALASAAAEHARLPFAEQIAFFRDKLNLPTAAWTDIWQAMHDRAFVVAGAARDDLLADLRSAVDSAVADGTTIARFRRDFDSIVKKHGWSYKGGRDWRTRVIYDTNLRTSYAAGRYRQMKEGVDRRPFWRYRHSHASEQPRQDHLAWDGLILRHDDPWLNTHYPPNGWGCNCYMEALNQRDIERLGKSGPDTAPPLNMRTVTVGEKGPSPRTVEVPEGIDPGWAYAPGQSGIFDDTGSAGE